MPEFGAAVIAAAPSQRKPDCRRRGDNPEKPAFVFHAKLSLLRRTPTIGGQSP